ncbi:PucR family transcriptional regulator [Smaragdicoccus niigatensis]|uniref:PucR family transcriptional regulator n=1 Tax=Smaragdicoccus niigatensis TaxID=359359 RepID=UPI000371F993|nr:PucR family transcriptional regulator [Smaragdicoccus niigatensis]
MNVALTWVLAQPDLRLRLVGGRGGVARETRLALVTELMDPNEWLSGGELVLTTGIQLPDTAEGKRAYLRRLNDSHVAGVGFGAGVTYDEVPADLITVADELDLPLIEVPRQIPFAAVVERVSTRIAELQYGAVLRASRAQPRMTRAVLTEGAHAILAELGQSLESTVLLLDNGGAVIDSHPRVIDPEFASAVVGAMSLRAAAGSASLGNLTVTHQQIQVGRRVRGHLVVVGAPLGNIDQVLLGHANSLLALDLTLPNRLRNTQRDLNAQALALLLGERVDLTQARQLMPGAADSRGEIRALVVTGDERAVERAAAAIERATAKAGFPVFRYLSGSRLTVVLPAAEGESIVDSAISRIDRRTLRAGMSAAHRTSRLQTAVDNANLAASSAEMGGEVLEFTSLVGSALLSNKASRDVLNAVADTLLTALRLYDDENGSELLPALRAFLESNGHWEAAAAAASVHRHTLRKRVELAQDVLGVDLDIARVRAELLLAILASSS